MTIARRFWSLVILILGLAIVCSAAAVWFTATPFLKTIQQRLIANHAQNDARALDAVLSEHRQLLSFVAGQDQVVSVVMGYTVNGDIMRDYLDALTLPPNLISLTLFDVLEEELAQIEFDQTAGSAFSSDEIGGVRKSILEGLGRQSASPVLLRNFAGIEHLLVAVPVVNRGLVEGVLTAEFSINFNTVFPPNKIAKATSIVPTRLVENFVSRRPGAHIEPVAGGALSLILEPDAQAVSAAGQDLLFKSSGAISAVLIGAFALFAWLGRTVILAPHERLSRQKKDLDELAAVARNANDAILVTDVQGGIVWGNPAFERLSGFFIDEVRGLRPGSFLQSEETDPKTKAQLRAAIDARVPVKAEILNNTRQGEPYWISISITPLVSDMGGVYGFMAISSDITKERKQREEIIAAQRATEYQARHDPLTSLPNRRVLNEVLEQRANSDRPEATLLRIDLDHFKYVNDTLGHAAGDCALEIIAEILREETKEDDLAARVGGDEFILILRPGTTIPDAVRVAKRILQRVRQPRSFEDKPMTLGASFGVASTSGGLASLDTLNVCADAALYAAKERGRNRIVVYDKDLHDAVLFRRDLASHMRRAISEEEFEPYFQPQIDALTGEICGVEALARWISPTLGLIKPDIFLPVAQQLSLVEDIDDIIFRKGSALVKSLQNEGIEIPKISFNVTAERILKLGDKEALDQLPTDGPKISFEILESVLVEEQSDHFRFALDTIRDRGFSIEVDDFGSGHASIVGLMQLQPDVMKIDRRLVAPISESETSAALLQSVIDMASVVGVRVTVEGVESQKHAEMVANMGCDVLQGFHFARPLSIDELMDFASNHVPSPISESLRRSA